jgi:hypothetical protein
MRRKGVVSRFAGRAEAAFTGDPRMVHASGAQKYTLTAA